MGIKLKRNEVYVWRQIVPEDKDILHITHIFPTQQRLVGKIVRYAEKSEGITQIVVFGSSTYLSCNWNSDIDLYIEGEFTQMDLYTSVDTGDKSLDIWKSKDVDKYLLDEIIETGVCVYERK